MSALLFLTVFWLCVARVGFTKPASLSTCLVVYIGALTRMARAIASLLRESITCIPLLSRIRSSAANTPVRELTYVNFQERHSEFIEYVGHQIVGERPRCDYLLQLAFNGLGFRIADYYRNPPRASPLPEESLRRRPILSGCRLFLSVRVYIYPWFSSDFCWRKGSGPMPFRDRHGNHARSETDTAIGGIYDSVLAWGYSPHVTVAVQRKGILAFARESAGEELRRVARLERHLYRGFSGAERIFRDPVYLFERNLASILPSCVIAVGDVPQHCRARSCEPRTMGLRSVRGPLRCPMVWNQ